MSAVCCCVLSSIVVEPLCIALCCVCMQKNKKVSRPLPLPYLPFPSFQTSHLFTKSSTTTKISSAFNSLPIFAFFHNGHSCSTIVFIFRSVSLMVCVELLCCCIGCLGRRRKNRAEGFVKQVVNHRKLSITIPTINYHKLTILQNQLPPLAQLFLSRR